MITAESADKMIESVIKGSESVPSENLNLYKDFSGQWLDNSQTAIEAYTSGSTGSPKRILLPKILMRRSAWRTIEYFGINCNWILGSCISAKYIGGKMMAVRAFELGIELFCESPSNRPELDMARKAEGKEMLISVVPSQLWHILTLPLTEEDKRRIRFLIGGSPIPDDLRRQIVAKGLRAWESYGMTETASHIALRPVTEEELPFTPLPGIRLSKSASGTLVIDDTFSLDGAAVDSGMLLPERPLVTNDLVEFDADGNFSIVGRADNVIITGGLKVIPEVAERKIRNILKNSEEYSGFTDLMIVSRPDPKWGEAVTLLIEIPENTSPSDEQEIGLLLRQNQSGSGPTTLRPQEIPKEIKFVRSLPRTSGGKLLRNRNRQSDNATVYNS